MDLLDRVELSRGFNGLDGVGALSGPFWFWTQPLTPPSYQLGLTKSLLYDLVNMYLFNVVVRCYRMRWCRISPPEGNF